MTSTQIIAIVIFLVTMAAIMTEKLHRTVAAVAGMGLAGQIAQGRMSGYDGNGSFRTYLLDALYNLDGDALEAGARVEELA